MQPPFKHIVQGIVFAEAGNVIRTIQIARGVLNPDPFINVTNCKAGSILGSISCFIDIGYEPNVAIGADTLDWYIGYNIDASQTIGDPQAVGGSHLRNQIFRMDQAVRNGNTVASTTVVPPKDIVFRFVLSIPRTWKQINDGDTLNFVYKFSNAAAVHDVKTLFIYKEYFP